MTAKPLSFLAFLLALSAMIGCDSGAERASGDRDTGSDVEMGDAGRADGADLGDAGMPCEIGDSGPTSACPDGFTCSSGTCTPQACEPNTSRCADAQTLEVCRQDGTGYEASPCEMGDCREMNGAATCDDVICVAGERTCNGPQTVVECADDGTRFTVVEQCDGDRTGRQCDLGECIPLCAINEKVKTNIGCDYWAADLDNALVPGGDGFLNAERAPYAVVVSNPHPTYTAQVTVLNNQEIE